jgi:transcription elongation GreA/GreB family factor
MPPSTLKERAYQFCKTFVEERLSRIRENIDSVQQSLSSETKSSAGDKHETGRAMLQLEREKLGRQLAAAERTRQLLSKVNIDAKSDKVRLGSLIQTSKATYFISISAGEFTDLENVVLCISAGTPIGQLLLGKSAGELVVFNESEILIKHID